MINTVTRTRTKTDIRKVFEMFGADLRMLAIRTQAMDEAEIDDYVHDIRLMAEYKCLGSVHIQLYDGHGLRIKAHQYCVEENTLSETDRPGANNWPPIPNGDLQIIVSCSDTNIVQRLKDSGKLKIDWSPSNLSIDYFNMSNDGSRNYSSSGYGLGRTSHTI